MVREIHFRYCTAIMLELRNPHSVMATLQVRPRAVRSVRVSSERTGTPWDEVAALARQRGIAVAVGREDRRAADRRAAGRRRETERVGAGSAQIEPPSPVPLARLWKATDGTNTDYGLWLALDQVQDPQNLGAIFRLAGFFGIRGVIMTKDKSAPVNGTVCDVATGGVEHVPFAIVPNLAQTLKQAQKDGIWVLGTCERASDSIRDVKRDRHWMLVMGNEGDGMRRLTRDTCDTLVSLPPLGQIPSLNVAAATSACLAILTGG
ncbi:MAG: RNA methyltransferase [Fuerstiella sp.]